MKTRKKLLHPMNIRRAANNSLIYTEPTTLCLLHPSRDFMVCLSNRIYESTWNPEPQTPTRLWYLFRAAGLVLLSLSGALGDTYDLKQWRKIHY